MGRGPLGGLGALEAAQDRGVSLLQLLEACILGKGLPFRGSA